MLSMNQSPQPTDWREGRRLRAWALYEQGWPQKQIAAALGVSKGAVSQWVARGKAGGVDALRNQPRSGATPKLAEQQRQQYGHKVLALGLAEALREGGSELTKGLVSTDNRDGHGSLLGKGWVGAYHFPSERTVPSRLS